MSDEPNLCTGMGEVHRHIGSGLHKRKHEIISLGWFSKMGGQNSMPWKIYHTSNQYYGQDVFDKVVWQEKPQIVICIGDPWMQDYIANPNICRTRRSFLWGRYTPVDGTTPDGGLPPTWREGALNADVVIAYTEYGKQAILKSCPELAGKIKTIPHGVNTNVFKPLPEKEIATLRRQLGLEGKICFLMVGRNQFRKNVPEFAKAWKKFTQNGTHPKAVFWPHMVFTDPMGWNLDEIFDILGIRSSLRYFEAIAHSQSNVDLLPEEDLNRLYNCCDVHVNIAGEGWCFVPNTLIWTGDRCFRIDSIKNTTVMGSYGQDNIVLNTFKRYYSGQIISIKPRGMLWTKMTPEHPVLICREKYTINHPEKIRGKDLSKQTLFVQAKDLRKNDILLYPVSDIKNSLPQKIYLEYPEHLKKYSNKGKHEYSWKNLGEIVGWSGEQVRRTVLNMKGHITEKTRNEIKEKLNKIGYEYKRQQYNILKEVEITPDLLYFFGLYIAEGSVNKGRVDIALNSKKEYNLALKLREIVENSFHRKFSIQKRRNANTLKCRFFLANIDKTFDTLFGHGARNKHIPYEWLKCNVEEIIPLLKGVFDGDGYFNGKQISLSSVSSTLIFQIRELLLHLGITCSIQQGKKGEYQLSVSDNKLKKIFNKPLNEKSNNAKFQWIAGRYLHIPIIGIKEENYSGEVFNLEVNNDNTYIANGFIVHNCLPVTAALSCGKPNISLDHSGAGEQVRLSNGGLTVKCNPFFVTGKYSTERPYPDENDLLTKMDLLYNRADLRQKLGQAGLKWAQGMTWEHACDMWQELIMETMYPLRKPVELEVV